MSQTLSQQRAQYSLERVSARKGGKDDDRYLNWCKEMPAMIVNNGLGQALAFLLADSKREDTPSKWLYDDIGRWLTEKRRIYASGRDVLASLSNGDRGQYIRAQRETLELLGWLKRFAIAYIEARKERIR